jgi:hypothetical protein
MTHDEAAATLAAERYLLGEMSDAERDAFEDHYFGCTLCAADVRDGALIADGARAGVAPRVARTPAGGANPAPARVVPLQLRRPWYQSGVIPWAAAATLAMIAGYQSLVLLPGLRQPRAPHALALVTLHPASRGEAPAVQLGREVTFALDFTAAEAAPELSYDLRTAAGTPVVSGRLPQPEPGAPLVLMIPAGVLTAPGPYVLSVGGAEYRFDAVP